MKQSKIKACIIAATIMSGTALFSMQASEKTKDRFFAEGSDFVKAHEQLEAARNSFPGWMDISREVELKKNAEKARKYHEKHPTQETQIQWLHEVGLLRAFRFQWIEESGKGKK